jgi:hypothetical protein
MFSQSTILLRVLLSATLNLPLEIKDLTQDAQEPMPPLWDTLMMDSELELDFPSGARKTIPGSCRATVGIIAGGGRNEKPIMKAGVLFHKFKRLRKRFPVVGGVRMNPLTILTVVVTTSTWVSPEPSADSPLQVKNLVSLPPEEQVLSEVPKQSRMSPKKSDRPYLKYI